MLRSEREQQCFLGGGGLELEIELPAESLSQGEPPGAIHPAPKGRVDHQLHAARLVEETLGHEGVVRRKCAEQAVGFAEILDYLVSSDMSGIAARFLNFQGRRFLIFRASSGRYLAPLGMRRSGLGMRRPAP